MMKVLRDGLTKGDVPIFFVGRPETTVKRDCLSTRVVISK